MISQECICVVYIVIHSCAASDIRFSDDPRSPRKAKKCTPAARAYGLFLVTRRRPIVGPYSPITGAPGEPIKFTTGENVLKDPALISRIIAGYSQFAMACILYLNMKFFDGKSAMSLPGTFKLSPKSGSLPTDENRTAELFG